jgi:hypothetical protein
MKEEGVGSLRFNPQSQLLNPLIATKMRYLV